MLKNYYDEILEYVTYESKELFNIIEFLVGKPINAGYTSEEKKKMTTIMNSIVMLEAKGIILKIKKDEFLFYTIKR